MQISEQVRKIRITEMNQTPHH